MTETTTTERPLIAVNGLRKYFPIKRGLLQREIGAIRAVDDVSFDIKEGETLGLVGESGCGKTTTARCILRAIDPTDGEVLYTSPDGTITDVAAPPERKTVASADMCSGISGRSMRDSLLTRKDDAPSMAPYSVSGATRRPRLVPSAARIEDNLAVSPPRSVAVTQPPVPGRDIRAPVGFGGA